MRKLLFVSLVAPLATVLYAACGGDDSTTPPPGTDASMPMDVARDTKKPVDNYVPPPDDTGPVCAPGDTSKFMPTWGAPVHDPTACTPAQIQGYADACIGGTTCTAFTGDAANKACVACLATPDTATSYGPMVVHMSWREINVAGCYAITDGDASAMSCAAKAEALNECDRAACEPNCPLPKGDQAAFSAFQTCLQNAPAASCAMYASALCADAGVAGALCDGNGPSGPVMTFKDYFLLVAPVFCSGASDGGTTDGGMSDAADDGSASDGGSADAAGD